MKIPTSPNPIRRALWRFDSLCYRHPWVPMVCLALCWLAVMAIEGIAP